MKLVKSLLLGGAAGLVAVSGASAADLAVTKPAPAEYVRVCSSEGAGFFYIPGTETCLKIGGWVQMDVDFADPDASGDFGFDFQPGARLEFDARTQTSLGTLRSFVGLEFYGNGASDGLALDRAFIQLGGFIVGRADTFFGFDDPLPESFGGGSDLIGYTATFGSGFYAGLAAEHPTGVGFVDPDDTLGFLVGNVGYLNGGTHVRLAARVGEIANNTEWGVNLQAQQSFGSGTTIFGSVGYLGDTAAGDVLAVALKLSQKFNDSFSGFIGAGYSLTDTAVGDVDQWSVKAGFDYAIVPGFTVGPEVTYTDNELTGDGYAGRLRFRRSF
jgi:hypothetical protein